MRNVNENQWWDGMRKNNEDIRKYFRIVLQGYEFGGAWIQKYSKLMSYDNEI